MAPRRPLWGELPEAGLDVDVPPRAGAPSYGGVTGRRNRQSSPAVEKILPDTVEADLCLPACGLRQASPLDETLAVTLVFESVIDGLLALEQRRGALPSGAVAPSVRDEYRRALTQLLNERDPRVRWAAEARVADAVGAALFVPPARRNVAALTSALLRDYRHALRQVPLRGVGSFV